MLFVGIHDQHEVHRPGGYESINPKPVISLINSLPTSLEAMVLCPRLGKLYKRSEAL